MRNAFKRVDNDMISPPFLVVTTFYQLLERRGDNVSILDKMLRKSREMTRFNVEKCNMILQGDYFLITLTPFDKTHIISKIKKMNREELYI